MLRISSAIRIKPTLKIHRGWPDFTAFASVFFLLLLFFLVGSSFVQVSGIPVDLPQTHSASSFGLEKRVVTIDSNSKIYFNDLPISGLDILKERLMEVSGASTDRSIVPAIVLRADSRAPFGIAARVMSLAEELKFNVFVLTVPSATQVNFMESEK